MFPRNLLVTAETSDRHSAFYIDYCDLPPWRASYMSESPSQAFMLIVQMMYSELKELTEDEQRRRLQDYTLCYDNICNTSHP